MKPHIGLKGTWQDQDMRFNYLTGETNELFEIDLDNNTTISTVGPYRMHGKTDVWGLGVLGGFDVSWYIL